MSTTLGPSDVAVSDVRTVRRRIRMDRDHPRYKWVALSNTTLGILLVTVNSSIVLISLPAIFRGIGLNPLASGNVGYLLWMLMGFLLVSAVLVVLFGRLGDMFGRVKVYNQGFAIFALSAIALSVDPLHGGNGALWLIGWRVVQGIGGAMLMANSTAILTDAFPVNQRGMALGVNQVAAIGGGFLGLLIGGVLSDWDWRAIFWVSVPIGMIGAVWSYTSLHELGDRGSGKLDWLGTVAFGVGLTALLTGITYGVQPYGGKSAGWSNPLVLAAVIGGVVVLAGFVWIESVVAQPMFNVRLFRIRGFGLGGFANLTASIGRGGLQFMLIVWLQGIWLPLHGYSFEQTPLWAGIYMIPLTVGFLLAGPVAGALSDRYGARPFATAGLVVAGVSFLLLPALPADFSYWAFALIIFFNGFGFGMFSSPNAATMMSSAPADERGAAAGMRGTLLNGGMALSMGLFFSLMVAGLSNSLPGAMDSGLRAQGVPADTARHIAGMPPVGSLFATFLGYNPIKELLGPTGLLNRPEVNGAVLTGPQFFPHLIAGPFRSGLAIVFGTAAVLVFLGALASLCIRENYVGDEKKGLDEARHLPNSKGNVVTEVTSK
jgi:MFS family permease